MRKVYKDRIEAGDLLVKKLTEIRISDAIVMGIPRGGVVVAARVAEQLDAPLDIIIPRKIGVPFNPEVAIGAVTQDGTVIMRENFTNAIGLTEKELEGLIKKEISEIDRRMVMYRGSSEYPDYSGKTIVLVDDGIATGFTIRAAIKSIKKMFKPKKIILVVPVMPPDIAEIFKNEVDRIVCPLQPENFYAVGQHYIKFDQTRDQEVIDLLHKLSDLRKNNTGGVSSMKKIALDDDLRRLRSDLEKEGFEVVDSTAVGIADAYIVSGMENNFMNMQNIATDKKVIDASGKEIKEIINELRGV